MNEQKHVILKVGLQPTACHKQEMLGKDNKHDFPQGVRSACRERYRTSRVQAPREAGNSPSGQPSPWLWARIEEEKKSRGRVSAPSAPR